MTDYRGLEVTYAAWVERANGCTDTRQMVALLIDMALLYHRGQAPDGNLVAAFVKKVRNKDEMVRIWWITFASARGDLVKYALAMARPRHGPAAGTEDGGDWRRRDKVTLASVMQRRRGEESDA